MDHRKNRRNAPNCTSHAGRTPRRLKSAQCGLFGHQSLFYSWTTEATNAGDGTSGVLAGFEELKGMVAEEELTMGVFTDTGNSAEEEV